MKTKLAIIASVLFSFSVFSQDLGKHVELETAGELIGTVDPEALLSIYKGKQDSIRTLRYEVEQYLDAPLYKSDPAFSSTPVAYSYYDVISTGSKLRAIQRAGSSPDDRLGTMDLYWDGTMNRDFDKNNQSGTLSAEKGSVVVMSPFDMALIRTKDSEWGTALERILTSAPDVTASRLLQRNNEELIVVESLLSRQRHYLDPSKNLLAVKSEYFYKGSIEETDLSNLIVQYTCQILESKEVEEGLWLPTKWQRIRRLGPPAPEVLWNEISFIEDYQAKVVEVNEEYPDSTFKFSFPMGTDVHDTITGRLYKEGDLTQFSEDLTFSELEVDVAVIPESTETSIPGPALSKETPKYAQDERRSQRIMIYVLLLGVTLSAIVFGFIVKYRKNRTPH